MSDKTSIARNGKIVFTGGGTGGHVYPNLALSAEFEKRGYSPVYIGSAHGSLEERLATQNGIPYFGIDSAKLIRSLSFDAIRKNAKIARTLCKSIKEAKRVLQAQNPSAVISKGGFASLPTVIAARQLKLPVFAHESDMTLGLANRIAKIKGATVLKANPNARFKGIFVGMPLRKSLFGKDKKQCMLSLGIDTRLPILLVLGGSSGAQAVNDAVLKNLDSLTRKYFVLHVTGKGKFQRVFCDNYKAYEYADDVSLFYGASDAVLSRAGATAVFELSALNKRALFIPLPKGISRGDQIDNAYLAQEYGANVLFQDEGFYDNFLSAIENTFKKPPMMSICADANGKIADIVCDRLRRGEKCKNKKPSPNGSPSFYS